VQQLHLAPHRLGRQRNVHRRAAQVTVPFRDLVGEIEHVAEGGGHYLGDGPVILMCVVPRRRDDDVGRAGPRHLFQGLLHLAPGGRQPALGQIVQFDREVRRRQEGPRRVTRFVLAVRRSGQDDVAGPQTRMARRETEQGPARADLDVVGVRPDREQ